MAGNGGYRPNAGRKKGSTNKDIDNIRELLRPHQQELIEKAVKMALSGNATIMTKLLDKLLPNLNSIDFASNEKNMPVIEINVRNNSSPT